MRSAQRHRDAETQRRRDAEKEEKKQREKTIDASYDEEIDSFVLCFSLHCFLFSLSVSESLCCVFFLGLFSRHPQLASLLAKLCAL